MLRPENDLVRDQLVLEVVQHVLVVALHVPEADHVTVLVVAVVLRPVKELALQALLKNQKNEMYSVILKVTIIFPLI